MAQKVSAPIQVRRPPLDLLSEFHHADVAFGEVVVERHAQALQKGLTALMQAGEQAQG